MVKPAPIAQTNLAHQAWKTIVPARNKPQTQKSKINRKMAVKVVRSDNGTSHSRITLRCGMGWSTGIGVSMVFIDKEVMSAEQNSVFGQELRAQTASALKHQITYKCS